MDDNELTKLAEEELMREAKRGEARAAVHGVMGWLRNKTPRTNKRFLSNTISNALQHNDRQHSVGTIKEETALQQKKEKLKQKERKDPYTSDRKTDNKKIKQSRKHKHSKSKHNQESNQEDFSSDEDRNEYRHHKRKQQKLHK